MADALQEMSVFSRVVTTGSLSAAARELAISPALVSRRLAALENRLGVRLINRTTRSLNLTVEGARYYDVCNRVLAEIQEADAEVSVGRVEPQGALKVALPASFGHQHVARLHTDGGPFRQGPPSARDSAEARTGAGRCSPPAARAREALPRTRAPTRPRGHVGIRRRP